MAVKQHSDTVHRLDPRHFRCQSRVIRRVKLHTPLVNLGRIGRFVPDRQPVKISHRAQVGGVLTGIQRSAQGVAVGIDHIAMKRRLHDSHISQKPVIEPVYMPIRIGQLPPAIIQPGQNIGGNKSAAMRLAQNDRASSLPNFNGPHVDTKGKSRPQAMASAPVPTSRAAACRSGARYRS